MAKPVGKTRQPRDEQPGNMRLLGQYLLSDRQIADGQETLSRLLAQGPVDVGDEVFGSL